MSMKNSFRHGLLVRLGAWLGCLIALAGSVSAASPWEELPRLPEPTGGPVCVELGGSILVAGGANWREDRKQWLRSVHRFDPAARQWVTLAPMAGALAHPVFGVANDTAYAIGGTDGRTYFAGVVRLRRDGAEWSATGGATVPAVVSAGGLVGEELIVVGGTDDPANTRGYRSGTWAWNIRTGDTRSLPDWPAVPVGVAASAVVGEELLVFGGGAWSDAAGAVVNHPAAHAFSPRHHRWRRLEPLPWAARGVTAVPLDATRVYVGGGFGPEGFTDRAWIYDVARDAYTPAPALPQTAMVALVRCGEYIYSIGGEDRPKHRSDLVHRARIADLLGPAAGR